jgi:hypothetical protein
MNATTDSRPHGDAAVAQAIEPRPKNRFSLTTFTERARPKREPIAPAPLLRRPPRLRPVAACTVDLAAPGRSTALPLKTPLDAAAMRAGIAVSGEAHVTTARATVHPRGTDAALDYLARHGIEPQLSADGMCAWPRTAKRMDLNARQVWLHYGRQIVARKRGEAIECEHPGRHPNGVSTVGEVPILGGAVFCYYHADGGER